MRIFKWIGVQRGVILIIEDKQSCCKLISIPYNGSLIYSPNDQWGFPERRLNVTFKPRRLSFDMSISWRGMVRKFSDHRYDDRYVPSSSWIRDMTTVHRTTVSELLAVPNLTWDRSNLVETEHVTGLGLSVPCLNSEEDPNYDK